jgi:hypothetical protein
VPELIGDPEEATVSEANLSRDKPTVRAANEDASKANSLNHNRFRTVLFVFGLALGLFVGGLAIFAAKSRIARH